MTFRWRSVQRRPGIECTIRRVPYEAWAQFGRFHYLTADLHRSAKCYVLAVDGDPPRSPPCCIARTRVSVMSMACCVS